MKAIRSAGVAIAVLITLVFANALKPAGRVALADERGCEIPGEKIHWIADYCMAQLETDDEIPASECIAKENAVAFSSVCAAKRHYKKAMCELSISRDALKGDAERCVADPDYVGATVRNGGVGGR
jgi:hypothetical protein